MLLPAGHLLTKGYGTCVFCNIGLIRLVISLVLSTSYIFVNVYSESFVEVSKVYRGDFYVILCRNVCQMMAP